MSRGFGDDLRGLVELGKGLLGLDEGDGEQYQEDDGNGEPARLTFRCPCGSSREFDLRQESPAAVVKAVQSHLNRCAAARGE